MHERLQDVLILLTSGLITVAVARQFRLPSLLAYILVGIAVGPHGLERLPHTRETAALADFGVVFLMFTIGLEFNLPRLLAMRRLVFGLGIAQVVATVLVTMGLSIAFAMSWQYGFALGGALAMSSTAIVARMLVERRDLHSTAGQQTMGVLLLQDLAVVPLMILIPALGSKAPALVPAIAVAALKGALVLAGLILIGHKLMRGWFDLVARQRSHELFVLNLLWLVVGLAFLTSWAGLSLALGAFLGGMLVSETVYRHQVDADIRPFRDVFLGLFFVTVGMQLNLSFVIANLSWVIGLLALLIFGKGLILLALSLIMRNPLPTAMKTAVQLAQAGEFGLVLVSEASGAALLDEATQQVAMASMLLSMLLAPVLIEQGNRAARRMTQRNGAISLREIEEQARHIENHVIVCGYGRTGQSLARFLAGENIPFIALDTDPQRVRQATAGGEQVVYGDADRPEVLLAAGLPRAKAVALTYADVASAIKVLHVVREARPDIPIVVRAADDSQLDMLKNAGATEVVPELLEASLMLAMQTLGQLGVPTARTMERVREIRGQRYESLRHFYRSEEDRLRDALTAQPEPRRSIEMPLAAHAVNKSYGQLDLARFSVKLIGFVRRGVRTDKPSESAIVAADDVVILAGEPKKLEAAERFLLAGPDGDSGA